jgi:hypothetical protein
MAFTVLEDTKEVTNNEGRGESTGFAVSPGVDSASLLTGLTVRLFFGHAVFFTFYLSGSILNRGVA